MLRARSVRAAVVVSFDDGDDESAAAATPEPQAQYARRGLLVLLETLPDRFRLPIVHVKVKELSVAKTARMLGMSESAVKIGVFLGLPELARFVQRNPS